MKTYVADNLMAFRKYFNDLYHRVRNYDRDRENYRIEQSRNGSPTLKVIRNGDSYYLHSSYNPEREANKWVEQIVDENENVKQVVFFGLGLGYHIEAYMQRHPDTEIFLYEPDIEVLHAALEARELKKILKHRKLVVFGFGVENYAIERFVNTFVEQVSQEHKIIISPGISRVYEEEIELFHEKLRSSILSYRGNMHTFVSFREEWPENIFMNMAKNVSSSPIHRLERAANNMPAVIVGSGPSLDVDRDYLQTVANRALIFAAGSSIQALLEMNIKPDMIFSIDGSERNYEAFRKFQYEDIPFVYSPYVKYKIIENKENHLFHVVMSNDTISQYLLHDESLKKKFFSTTSVTGTVLQTATLMGCDPIILMGQDLSYPGGKIYANNVSHIHEQDLERIRKKSDLTVENVQGGLNDISNQMLIMLRDMEVSIEIFSKGKHVYNSSKLGAVIKGTEFKEIEKLLQDTLTHTLDKQKFYAVLDEASSEPYSENEAREILSKMEKLRVEIESIVEMAKRIGEQLDQLETTHKGDLEKMIDDVDRKWLTMARNEVFDRVVSIVVQNQFAAFKRYLPMIKEELDVHTKARLICKHMGMVVSEVIRAVPQLMEKLDAGIVQYRTKLGF